MYQVKIKNSAKSDLKKIKNSNLIEQFQDVVNVLEKNPYEHSQSFEKLEPRRLGRYSRRINRQHRVVYKVNEEQKLVKIYSAWSHYE